MVLKVLKAGNGDSLILNFNDVEGKSRNILIDGGNIIEEFHHHILPTLEAIINKDEFIDLMIGTHSDQDHIKGLNYLFERIKNSTTTLQKEHIKEIWFNSSYKNQGDSTDISAHDASILEKHLEPFKEKWKRKLVQGNEYSFYGSKITILSPNEDGLKQYRDKLKLSTDIGSSSDHRASLDDLICRLDTIKENLDNKIENASSIAFLFEYASKSILFLGDSNPKIIETALEKLIEARRIPYLEVSCIKLSHHGSIKSISKNMLDLVKTNHYIVSTNGGKKMPNKITLAKILAHLSIDLRKEINFYFNYSEIVESLRFESYEKAEFKFKCTEPNDPHGYILDVLKLD